MNNNYIVWDIETESLTPKQIYCIGTKRPSIDAEVFTKFHLTNSAGPNHKALNLINSAGLNITHNGIGFDIPVVEKLLGKVTSKCIDTLLLSKIIYSTDELYDIDRGVTNMPPKLWGRHSLEAFGWRLGQGKLEYDDWSKLSSKMVDYCAGDCLVTEKLYNHLISLTNYPDDSVIELEEKVARIIYEQSYYGFYMDVPKTEELNRKLLLEKLQLKQELTKVFKPKYLPDGPLKKTNKLLNRREWLENPSYKFWTVYNTFQVQYTFYKNGKIKFPKKPLKWHDRPMRFIIKQTQGEYQPIKLEVFNPGSRQHIRLWLKHDHGYSFPFYTPKGNAKVDVDSLTNLDHVAGKMLVRYLKVVKDQGQVGGAEGSFLKNLRPDGTVTSRIDTNGTVTGRFTSSKINLNQIPAQKEFRELFSAPQGWTFIGTDFSGQENVNLAEMLYKYDNGRLDEIIAQGSKDKGTDLHSLNAKACNVSRVDAKPLWFGFLYGSSETLTGYTLLGNEDYSNYTEAEWDAISEKLERRLIVLNDETLYPIKKDMLVPYTPQLVKQALFGKHTQEKLIASTTGLAELIKDLTKEAKRNGYVTMLGGRKIPIRHAHATLNSQLQGMGAEAMKYYLVFIHDAFKEAGLVHGRDFIQQATIYDEVDFICKDEYVEVLTKTLQDTYEKVSTHLGMQCTYTGEVLTGNSWQDCH